MKIKPMLAVAMTSAAVGGATLLGGALVSAQSNTNSTGIVDKIASRFNLNPSDVQQVFDEAHQERESAMKQKVSEHLQSKVDDGTITNEQKSAIEAKLVEMDAKRDTLRDQELSPKERRDAMRSLHEELKTWADSQGIDLQSLLPSGGKGHGRHGMGHGGDMMPDDAELESAPNDDPTEN